MNPEQVCVLCKVKDDSPTAKLGKKGCMGLMTVSKKKGDVLSVSPGQIVHLDCRKVYCHPNQHRKSKEQSDLNTSLKTRKSGETIFAFESKCIFCGTDAKQNENKRGYDVFPVRTLDFQYTIKKICKQRNDEWGNDVLCRLEFVHDLPAAEARYHQVCSVNFRTGYAIPAQYKTPVNSQKRKRGRPTKKEIETAFCDTMKYFENHEHDQVTVSDLVKTMSQLCGEDESYSTAYMKKKIIEYFGNAIILSELNGKRDVVTFRSTAHSILHSFYKRNDKSDCDSEKNAVIQTAVKLIFSDIKSGENSKKVYPTPAEIMSLESNLKCVPGSLQLFLNKVIDNKQGEKKTASIGQAIVQAACPRSVINPLQIGLGVQVHHLVGTKMLVESLNSLGFCSSYQEVLKFESCAAVTQGTTIQTANNEFVQYIADNVDHNICTLDGLNTFHGMGIIATVTPRLKNNQVIPRINVANEEVTEIAKIDIHFYKQKSNNMEEMIFKQLIDLTNIEEPLRELEFLIKIARPLKVQAPGWSGFMQMVHDGKYPGESSLMFMPMIDMSASDMSCIFSTLHFVVTQSQQLNTTPVLTFDQPLYWKALSIIVNEPSDSRLKSVVVRLGGFHTEMSFLGCIGRIMENTGLKELLATAYAENTVGHMLDGKAINRAVRGHFLVEDALNILLFEKMLAEKDQSSAITDINNNSLQTGDDTNDDTEPEIRCEENIPKVEDTTQQNDAHKDEGTEENNIHEVEDILHDIMNKRKTPESIQNHKTIREFMASYDQMKLGLLKFKTARLWLQYMEMTDILKLFIKAERTGNWCLHLKSLRKMLPFFAAAGHNLYLKSAYLYLQQMISLPDSNPQLHKAFCDGFHVVRRSDRYWGGLSTDLVIEQVLMRSVKSVGGLTRGRGMTESQRAHWLLSVPVMAEMNHAMQEFTEQRLQTSEQHKESTESRIKRDEKDRNTFADFLRERDPFAEELDLRNIETGVIADETVNAYSAKEVGENIIQGMADKQVNEYTFKRKSEVVTLGKQNNVKVDGVEIHVDSQLLFQRLIAVADMTLDDKEDMFQYELCGNPSSLFDSAGLLREPQKASLANALWDHNMCGTDIISDDNVYYVLDGGSLIQRIPWSYGQTFDSICLRYTDYVERNYGNAYVVFDGYCNGPSTKDVTHERRARGVVGAEIKFAGKTPFKTKKESVLSNKENKQRFINLLSKHMQGRDIRVSNADGDADVLIAETGVKLAKDFPTVVVGEDTDLLILLCYLANESDHNLYFTSDSNKCMKNKKIWDIKATKCSLGAETCRLLPFVHAFSGCDTTSRIYGIGKGAMFKKIATDAYFRQQAHVFMNSGSSHDDIAKAGEHSFTCLYNGTNETLNNLRYRKFIIKATTSTSVVQVQTLPPTEAAAKFHSYRVYHQVQMWIGNKMNPLEWGWCKLGEKLVPIKTQLPAAPESLLNIIKCNCKVNCDTKRCSCRKHGLSCSVGCGGCRGTCCSNSMRVDSEEFEPAGVL